LQFSNRIKEKFVSVYVSVRERGKEKERLTVDDPPSAKRGEREKKKIQRETYIWN
jgi:hypothetical protein